MSQITVTSYEGIVRAFELDTTDETLQFKQIINSQVCDAPIKCQIIIQNKLCVSSNRCVYIYCMNTKKLLRTIENKNQINNLFTLQNHLFILHDSGVDVHNFMNGASLVQYRLKHQMQSVSIYNDTNFTLLNKNQLLALNTNTQQVLSTLPLPQSYFYHQFMDLKHVILLNDDIITKFNIEDKKHCDYKSLIYCNFNCCLIVKNHILIGCKNSQLILLNEELQLIKQFQISQENIRIKQLFSVDNDVYCCISANGLIQVFAIDFEEKEIYIINECKQNIKLLSGSYYLKPEALNEEVLEEEEEFEEEFEEESEKQ